MNNNEMREKIKNSIIHLKYRLAFNETKQSAVYNEIADDILAVFKERLDEIRDLVDYDISILSTSHIKFQHTFNEHKLMECYKDMKSQLRGVFDRNCKIKKLCTINEPEPETYGVDISGGIKTIAGFRRLEDGKYELVDVSHETTDEEDDEYVIKPETEAERIKRKVMAMHDQFVADLKKIWEDDND